MIKASGYRKRPIKLVDSPRDTWTSIKRYVKIEHVCTLEEACKIRSVSCQSGISKKLSIISILLRDFLTSFDKIDKKNGLDVAAAVLVVLLLEGQFLTTPTLKMHVHL